MTKLILIILAVVAMLAALAIWILFNDPVWLIVGACAIALRALGDFNGN